MADADGLRRLEALRDAEFNFELSDGEVLSSEDGWRVDDHRQPLPPEPPGPPLAGGSWERARALMLEYAFADPKVVRAVYAPDSPLEGRDMLLEVRFWFLRFHWGVRVGGEVDETAERDGRPVRRWGWSYRTLAGHLEKGKMDYEVWKWLDTGEVEFRVHVVSRAAHIPNPLIRWGFRLFGRREQVRFAERACERMAALVDGASADAA